MGNILKQTFLGGSMGVCIKDLKGRVLKQNKLCSKICGNYMGDICKIACMELYAEDETWQWNKWGGRVYSNSFVHNAFYDITLLCNEEHLVTFLLPLEEKHKAAFSYYKKLNLTKRETEIISHIIQGVSNQKIYEKLSISKATLKTHLNNIYKKANEKGVKLKYIPSKRLSLHSV